MRRFLPALRGVSSITESKSVGSDEAKAALTSYYSGPYATSYRADRFGGKTWSTETAVVDGYERVVYAFKAINTIATQQARLPFAYTDADDQNGELITDLPWCRILNGRANPIETGKQFRRRLSSLFFLSKHGVFVEVSRSRAGTPVRADILAPDRTRPVPGKGADLISHYEYTDAYGSRRELGVDKVVWIRDPHPLDPLLGSTPLEAAGLSVELDYHARRYNVTFLRNDGRPGMLIAVKGDLDDAEAQRLEMHFAPGPENAGRTTVVEADGLDAKDFGVNPRDMAYESAAASAKNETLVAFGTPESVLGNASGRCVDDQTEALTQRGWVSGWEITEDDVILSTDPETGRLVWGPVREVYRNPNWDGDVFRLKHAHMDSLVTPGHKWLVDRGASHELVPVEELKGSDRIRVTGLPEAGAAEATYSSAFVELVGWYVTEGHQGGKKTPYLRIRQNVGENADRIELVLKEVGARYTRYERNASALFNVSGEIAVAVDAVAPGRVMATDFILALTAEQREMLMQTMVDADGSRQQRTSSLIFTQKSQAAAEAFLLVATLAGRRCSIKRVEYDFGYEAKSAETQVRWRVIVGTRSHMTIQRNTRTSEHYQGLVWCPRTDYGTFVARREGRVFTTGNTWDNADVEMGMFWELTMTAHLDIMAEPFVDPDDETLIPLFNTTGVDALNRPKRLQRQEAREEFQAGLRPIDSYLRLAGIEDIAESTPQTRAFWLPAGKMPIAANETDQEDLGMMGAAEAPPGEAPPGALNPDDMERDTRDERTLNGFEQELDEETVDPETIGPPDEEGKRLDLTAGGAVYSDFDRDQLEQAVATALQMWATRHAEVWSARLRSPKIRRGTLLWEPDGEDDPRVGTKEIDVDRVTDKRRWLEELSSTMAMILEPTAYAAAMDLAADLGMMLTETPARTIARQAVEAAMIGVSDSASRWLDDANGFLRVGLASATSAADLEGIVESLQAFVRARSGAWIAGLSSQAATSTVEASRSITANEVEGEQRRKIVRQWLTRKDVDVRDSHRVADQQTRAIGEPFVVGGYEMQFPGDPTAPPGQTRNCRCRVVYRSSETGRFVPAR